MSQMAGCEIRFLKRIRIDMCQPSEDVIKIVTFNLPDGKVLDCLSLFISAGTWEENVQKSKPAFYMESADYS